MSRTAGNTSTGTGLKQTSEFFPELFRIGSPSGSDTNGMDGSTAGGGGGGSDYGGSGTPPQHSPKNGSSSTTSADGAKSAPKGILLRSQSIHHRVRSIETVSTPPCTQLSFLYSLSS